MPSFQDYLTEKAPKLEEFRQLYGDQFYKDLGFESTLDAYKTADSFAKYVPENTYKYELGKDDYVKDKSGKNVDISIGGNEFDLKRSKEMVSADLSNALNNQITGVVDKTPTEGTVLVYGNNAYVYSTDKGGGWYALEDGIDNVENFKEWYVGHATDNAPEFITNSPDMITSFRGRVNMAVDASGIKYDMLKTNKELDTKLHSFFSQRYTGFGKHKQLVVKYDGKYYARLYNGDVGRWYEILDYKPTK
jgi:hypothetical protein